MQFTIYGKNTCAYCDRAKDLITEKEDTFTFFNVEEDAQHHAEMGIRAPGARTVPQIFLDNTHIGGYDELRKWYKENPK